MRNRAHTCVLNIFAAEQKERGLTKAQIARKLNKRPEVVSRELTAPGNWTLDTYASYLIAMGYLPSFSAENLRDPQRMPNRVHALVDSMTISAIPPVSSTGSAGGNCYSNGKNSGIKPRFNTSSKRTIYNIEQSPMTAYLVSALICDDVRHENTGKQLLIGIDGRDIVLATFPSAVILTLWMRFRLMKPFRALSSLW